MRSRAQMRRNQGAAWSFAFALLAAGCGGAPAPAGETCTPGTPPADVAVTVNLRFDGGGTATVTSDPPGIDCAGGACTATFPECTPVTLLATPTAGAFVRWEGACKGKTCSFLARTDTAVGARFLGANYVFVTSTEYSPAGLTLAGADAECAARAAEASLPGTYVAWLSTSTVDAESRLGTARGWVRTDGLPFADLRGELLAFGQVLYPPRLDEWGRPPERTLAITGTSGGGWFVWALDNCSDWTSTSGNFAFGSVTAGTGGWTYSGSAACSPGLTGHLYCLGTDVAAPVAPTATGGGRLAFVSGYVLPGPGGVEALDAQCAADAAAAALSGSFKALVATSSASASSRFDLGKGPWVRTDGVAIVSGATDLLDQDLLAPIDATSYGVYWGPERVWTGASSPGAVGTAATTCSDWTSTSATSTGSYGVADETQGPPPCCAGPWGYFSTGDPPTPNTVSCDGYGRVYCLQE